MSLLTLPYQPANKRSSGSVHRVSFPGDKSAVQCLRWFTEGSIPVTRHSCAPGVGPTLVARREDRRSLWRLGAACTRARCSTKFSTRSASTMNRPALTETPISPFSPRTFSQVSSFQFISLINSTFRGSPVESRIRLNTAKSQVMQFVTTDDRRGTDSVSQLMLQHITDGSAFTTCYYKKKQTVPLKGNNIWTVFCPAQGEVETLPRCRRTTWVLPTTTPLSCITASERGSHLFYPSITCEHKWKN